MAIEEPEATLADGVHRATVAHAELLSGFFRKVWDANATAASVRLSRLEEARFNPANPGEEVPTFIFVKNGEAAGYVTSIPFRLWMHGVERPAHWVKGLMVLPEYQNGPVGFFLLKELVGVLGNQFAVAGAPPAIRLFRALGYTDAGPIPNFIKLLRPGTVLSRIKLAELGASAASVPRVLVNAAPLLQRTRLAYVAGQLLGGAMFLAALRGGGRRDGQIAVSDVIDFEETQRLWERIRGTFPTAPARNLEHVGALLRNGDNRYRILTLRVQDQLAAYAVLRTPSAHPDARLAGIGVCTISDLVYSLDSPRTGLRLLQACESEAHALGAHAILCSTSSPLLADSLRRRAFLNVSGNINFLFKSSGDDSTMPVELSDWWLLRGDSQADGAF